MSVKIKLLGFILLALLANGWGKEVTVYNPDGSMKGTYTTIQVSIDACPDGGTVTVSSKVYNETISIRNKSIALIGIGRPIIVEVIWRVIQTNKI